jgi:hypothetical protein
MVKITSGAYGNSSRHWGNVLDYIPCSNVLAISQDKDEFFRNLYGKEVSKNALAN